MGHKITDMKNILVTGATGFIGTHLCRALANQHYCIHGLSRTGANGTDITLPERAEFHIIAGDIRYLNELQNIIRPYKLDTIIHLAACNPQNGEDKECFETNVDGTYNLLYISHQFNIRHFIYASTQEVYGLPSYIPVDENHPKKPDNFYGFTKLQSENLCEFFAHKHQIKTIILRYAGVFGPGKNYGAIYNFFQNAFRNEQPQILQGGNQTRDFVYIDDAVDGTIKALKKVNQVSFEMYNIGGGKEVKVCDLAKLIYSQVGSNIEIKDSSFNSQDRFYLDIIHAQETLKYYPRPLEEALKQMALALKNRVSI